MAAIIRKKDAYFVLAADLIDVDHEVNLQERAGGIGKHEGLIVFRGTGVDDAGAIPVFAEGAAAASDWSQFDGVVKYSPV